MQKKDISKGFTNFQVALLIDRYLLQVTDEFFLVFDESRTQSLLAVQSFLQLLRDHLLLRYRPPSGDLFKLFLTGLHIIFQLLQSSREREKHSKSSH